MHGMELLYRSTIKSRPFERERSKIGYGLARSLRTFAQRAVAHHVRLGPTQWASAIHSPRHHEVGILTMEGPKGAIGGRLGRLDRSQSSHPSCRRELS